MPKQVTAFLDCKGYLWQSEEQALAADCQYRLGEIIGTVPPLSIVHNADKVIAILTAYRAAAKTTQGPLA